MGEAYTYRYPRRRVVRTVLRGATAGLLSLLSDLQVRGLHHVPRTGPVILAANHFTFVDAPILLRVSPRLVEFIGGAERPNSPGWSHQIPKAWGFIPARRGAFTRDTLRHSLGILEQGGVLGVFPEGGNWAGLLRPARPGVAFLAAQSGVPVIPVSIVGAESVLTARRAPVCVSFHAPVSAPVIASTGRIRRGELDAFGSEIMARIADGLPDGLRGLYSTDLAARDAAAAVSAYPFAAPEMRGI